MVPRFHEPCGLRSRSGADRHTTVALTDRSASRHKKRRKIVSRTNVLLAAPLQAHVHDQLPAQWGERLHAADAPRPFDDGDGQDLPAAGAYRHRQSPPPRLSPLRHAPAKRSRPGLPHARGELGGNRVSPQGASRPTALHLRVMPTHSDAPHSDARARRSFLLPDTAKLLGLNPTRGLPLREDRTWACQHLTWLHR
jgi:hypothetical protein